MPPSDPTTGVLPAADLAALVEAARIRLRAARLAVVAAGAVAAIVGFLLLAAGVDMLLPLPVALRVAAFVLFIALLAAAALTAAWCWLAAPDADAVARRIEALVPDMHNRLITVLDLRRRDAEGGHLHHAENSPFVDQLIDQTRQRLAPFRPRHLTDPRHLQRAIAAALLAMLLAPLMLLVFSSRMPTALARLFAPIADIAPVTGLAFHALPGDLDALQGEPVTLAATIERGETDALDVQLRAAGDHDHDSDNAGDWHRYPMQRQAGGRFTFALTALDRSYEYRILGGRTWSPVYRVSMVHRPIVERVAARIHLPAYMGIAAPIEVADEGPISAPIGAEVELIATARGEAAAGILKQLSPVNAESDRGDMNESVWFDDAVPADAQVIGDWRWMTKAAYSGSKSHGFDGSLAAYGFRTNLSPLALPAGASFFMYARVDGDAPPSSLKVTLMNGQTSHSLVWGEVISAAAAKQQTARAGAMPKAGAWVRLEAPIASLLGLKGDAAMKFNGITFEIDRGRILLDRAGVLTRPAAATTQTQFESQSEVAMTRGEAGWSGRITVTRDTHLAVELLSGLGHASPVMTPRFIEARADAAPWLHIEKPGRAVTLNEVRSVPIAVRAFDDYGVAAVGLQVSRDVGAFATPVKWIETWDEPLTGRIVVAAIEPVDGEGKAVAMGEAFFCRAVARDRKGQVGYGEAIRIAFVKDEATPAPGTTPTPGTPDRSNEIAALMKQLREYAERQGQLSTDAARVLDALTKDPQALRELDARLAQQRMAASQLARKLDDQAAVAEKSPLASDLEDDVLRHLAEQMRELARSADATATEAAMLERLRQLTRTSTQQQEQLAQMLRQLQSLDAARKQMAADPKQAHRSFENLLAELQAQGATQELARLAEALETRKQAMAEFEKQQAQLAKNSDAKSLDKTGGEQKSLDEKAIPAVDKANDLLRKQQAEKEKLKTWEPSPPTAANDESKRAAMGEELKQHQQALARQLGESKRDLSSAKEQAMRLAESLRLATSKDDKSELQSILASAAMKTMMSMAGRARSQAIEEAQLAGGANDPENPSPPERASGQQNAANVRRGEVLPAGAGALDPAAAAALYRLPPELREALLGGMNERGPAGYQRLIDAYYRQLTEGMK